MLKLPKKKTERQLLQDFILDEIGQKMLLGIYDKELNSKDFKLEMLLPETIVIIKNSSSFFWYQVRYNLSYSIANTMVLVSNYWYILLSILAGIILINYFYYV